MLRNALRKNEFHVSKENFLFRSISSSQSLASQSHNTEATANKTLPQPRSEEEALQLIRHCCKLGSLSQAKRLHAFILQHSFVSAKISSKYLVRMYSLCGSIDDAQRCFDDIRQPDVVSWTELLKAYARNGHFDDVLGCFRRMLQAGIKPDVVLLSKLLHGASVFDLEKTKFLDMTVESSGYGSDLMLGTSLVTLYGRCGGVEESKAVFARMRNPDAAAWNAMIRGCVRNGVKTELLFEQGDAADYLSVLKTCKFDFNGKAPRAEILETSPDLIAALIDYHGDVELAEKLLFTFGLEYAQCWTSLLVAYARQGYHSQVIQFFHEMQCRKLTPNFATFAAVLDACAGLGALVEGRLIHRRVLEVEKLPISGTLAKSLVNMYAKCGQLEEAWDVFADVTERDVNLWNTCIEAFAVHGQGLSVLRLFQLMNQDGMKPNQNTFSSLLFVSCYVNLVEAGYAFFTSMATEYCLVPTVENYTCMVALLGREGDLDAAQELVSRTPHHSNPVLWISLLVACRNQGDIERGKGAAVQAFRLDPAVAEVYVVLSRIYEREQQPQIARRIKLLREERDVTMELARSWIEINGVVNSFTTDDKSHPHAEEIYAALEKLEAEYPIREGFLSNDSVMHDVDEEDESSVHSEKLAVVFGLINSGEGTPLVVFKNKRMCSECHTFIKLLSKLAARDIVVRDNSRFHRFTHGTCSCGDYW